MSVCSGLDQIEDFLLSSTSSIATTSTNNQSSSFIGVSSNSSGSNNRFMGPPFPMGNLNGLNLSLNHGLDLTCPTYGCLNLTQNNHSRQDSHNLTATDVASTGLNLTQQSHGNFNNSATRDDAHSKKDASEVGLNLSLQNGMDLTRQTYYYDGSDFDYGSQQQSNQFDSTQHRNSPLNLEHRCSPLNLTHNKFNQNQYFNFNQNQNYTNYTSYNSEGANYYYCPTTQQQSQDQQHYSQDYNPQQSIAKIRLFCSTCSQEFATSNELNKHMEKHNLELNSACSSNYLEPHTNNSNKRAFDYEHANSAMNYKVAEEELVLVNNSTNKKEVEPQTSCSECSLHFPTGVDLKKHIDLAHRGRQGGKRYQCLQCAAEFDDIKSHKIHVDAHALEKPFKCSKCGLHLTNASGLKRHIRRVHDKSGPTFDCQECSKTFFEKFDLQRHMKVHSTPKCEKCGKNKSNKEKKTHVCKIPESERDPSLKCTVCGVFLDNKVKWGFHMWKHTKDPAYIQTKPAPDPQKVTDENTNNEQPLSLIKL